MKLLDLLARLENVVGIVGQPRRLRELIEYELREYFNLPPIKAAEQAEQLEIPIRKMLIQNELVHTTNGTFPILTLSSLSDRIIMGSCHVQPTDDERIVKIKESRQHIDRLLSRIRLLSFVEFEQFGAAILKELGARTIRVTPRANDQGIDFYGVMSLGDLIGEPSGICQLAHDLNIRFAGQAKHYPSNPIGPAALRELVGAVSLARYKNFTRDTDIFEDLDLRSFTPLIAMFFTTGTFTNGARDLANQTGIIARSGDQLAVFLADRRIGFKEIDGKIQFDDQEFSKWMENRD